jgi:outer membrane lipoprotein-sorting protein
MNDHHGEDAFGELESALETAVQAVLSQTVPDDAVERVKARAKTLDGPVASPRPLGRAGGRRLARYGGLAAAVALVLTAGLWLLRGQSTGPAFADVIQNVQQATSLEVTAEMRFGERGDRIKMYLEQDRLRMEMNDGFLIVVCDLNQGTALYQDVRRKRYQLDDVSERLANQMMTPIDQLRHAKPDDAEHVGEERVNGRLAELYRMHDAEFLEVRRRGEMLVWVDPTNNLPVRIVVRGLHPTGTPEVRFEDFRWNERLDDHLFTMEPPEDYVEGGVLTVPRPKSAERPGPPVSPPQ